VFDGLLCKKLPVLSPPNRLTLRITFSKIRKRQHQNPHCTSECSFLLILMFCVLSYESHEFLILFFNSNIIVLCLESARRACSTICTHSRGGGGGGGGEQRDKWWNWGGILPLPLMVLASGLLLQWPAPLPWVSAAADEKGEEIIMRLVVVP
jgi:hypothetical protein